MSPSDQTKEKPEPRALNEGELAWLGRIIGGKNLYADGTGLKAKDEEGNEFDIAEAIKEVEEYDLAYEAGEEPEGFYALELMGKRETLKKLGIPGIVDLAEEDRQKREKKQEALDKVRNLIELQKEDIRSSTDYNVKVKRRAEVFGKEILYGSKTVQTKGQKRGLDRFKPQQLRQYSRT